jgi:hypothetical protein
MSGQIAISDMPAARARSFAPADKGWLAPHESGTYVKFTPAGAELFA